MSSKKLHPLRKQSLRNVSGRVLEIGFGTGLNLPFYPEGVEEVQAVDVNPEMAPKALARIEKVSFPVQHHVISGEAMPMENDSFDFVVSTFTLCSIAKVEQAIGEIWRVLRPGGGSVSQNMDSLQTHQWPPGKSDSILSKRYWGMAVI
ncbi:MAG: class I SAM-dependent methyltransferase [SAR324 cluster bacterium]|nr:class I SAM-dependent methyltransferase [SAR324 cluster bacterium]